MDLSPRLVAHLRSGQVSEIVYGSIIGLALVLTMEAHPPRLVAVIGTLLSTALAVSLAEVYADLVETRVRASVGSRAEPVGTAVSDAAAVAFGIAFPTVFFLTAALGLIDLDTAFELAKWTGLGLIAGYGFLTSKLSGTPTTKALLHAAAVGVIAALLIAFKALVH